jgi:hypothetical protein
MLMGFRVKAEYPFLLGILRRIGSKCDENRHKSAQLEPISRQKSLLLSRKSKIV